MTPEQRAAIECLWRGDGAESLFDEFASVTSIWFDPIVAPIEVHPDGIRSSVKVAGVGVYDLALDRVRNPVTREEEITFLDHPTGFNSKYSELGTSAVARFRSDVASSDHIGKYAKYAKVEYSGPP